MVAFPLNHAVKCSRRFQREMWVAYHLLYTVKVLNECKMIVAFFVSEPCQKLIVSANHDHAWCMTTRMQETQQCIIKI